MIRTLAGQVRRTGVRREVELDLPRSRAGADAEPLGVQLRAAGLGGGSRGRRGRRRHRAHRLARVRRDFVANVSHELKTPVGALQLLAEALLDATDRPAVRVRCRPNGPRRISPPPAASPSASSTSPAGSAGWSRSCWS